MLRPRNRRRRGAGCAGCRSAPPARRRPSAPRPNSASLRSSVAARAAARPASVILASVARPSRSDGDAARRSRRRSSAATIDDAEVRWTWRRSPSLPIGSSPCWCRTAARAPRSAGTSGRAGVTSSFRRASRTCWARMIEVTAAIGPRRLRAPALLPVAARLGDGVDAQGRHGGKRTVGSAASPVVTPRRRASASKVVPCTTVETSTAKNAIAKNSSLRGTPSRTGNVASTTGTAPRSPAQPSTARSRRSKPAPVVATSAASGRATTAASSASTVPSSGDRAERVGEDEQAERQEHRQLGDPGEAVVEGLHRLALGQRRAAERRGPRGRSPGSRSRAARRRAPNAIAPIAIDATGYRPGVGQRHAAHQRDARARRRRGPRPRRRDSSTTNATAMSTEAVALGRDPGAEAEHEQDGDGVVEAGLALERPRDAAAQRRAAQDREDRRAVGGGEDRAEQQALEQAEVQQPGGGEAGEDGGERRADERQRERRPQHRPDLREAGGQAALEEDRGQRDDPDRAWPARSRRSASSRGRRSRAPCRGR